MIIVTPPFPFFPDLEGNGLTAGYLYIGSQYTNPEVESNQIQVWWDSDLSIPAVQPIRTIGGFPARNGAPAALYTAGDFSITCRDSSRKLIFYARTSQEFSASAYLSQKYNRKSFIASPGQVDFVVNFELRAGADAESVYYNGTRLTYSVDYSIVGTTTIRLVNACDDLDEITVIAGNDLSAYSISPNNIPYYDPIAPAYLKNVSDMLDGTPISLMRFIDKVDRDKYRDGVECTTDLTSHILEAVDAIETYVGYGNFGGTLLMPLGTVWHSQEIQLGHSVTMRGPSDLMNGCILKLKAGSSVRSQVTNKYYPGAQEYWGLKNMGVDGNLGSATVTEAQVLLNSLFVGSAIEKVLIQYSTGQGLKITNGGTVGGTVGAGDTGAGPIRIQSLWVNHTQGYPINIEDDAARAQGALNSIWLIDCTVENFAAGLAGVRLKNHTSSIGGIMIGNLHIESSGADMDGVLIDGCPNVIIDGLSMWGTPGANRNLLHISNDGRNVNISARGFYNENGATYVVADDKNNYYTARTDIHYFTPECIMPVVQNQQTLTYGATVNTNMAAGNYVIIAVSNTTAFTIANPTNPRVGQRLTFEIVNNSGGIMGTITWGSHFVYRDTSWVNPVNGKRRLISFIYRGSNTWAQDGAATGDM